MILRLLEGIQHRVQRDKERHTLSLYPDVSVPQRRLEAIRNVSPMRLHATSGLWPCYRCGRFPADEFIRELGMRYSNEPRGERKRRRRP